MEKIKTNHPFTVAQLKKLNEELEKISNTQIGLKGVQIPGKKNFHDIKITHSPYMLDVFLSFTDLTVPEYPKFKTFGIKTNGEIDYQVKQTLEFDSLADRVSFFNTLQPIEFTY